MEGTRENFNEHARVANTAVYNIYISYYISPPSLNSARAEQQGEFGEQQQQEEKLNWSYMNVVPRSTMNTNGETEN